MLPKNIHILPAIVISTVIGYCVSPLFVLQFPVNSDTTSKLSEQIYPAHDQTQVTSENLSCKLSNHKVNQKVASQVFTMHHSQLLRLLRK
jgi:hypothetical protein